MKPRNPVATLVASATLASLLASCQGSGSDVSETQPVPEAGQALAATPSVRPFPDDIDPLNVDQFQGLLGAYRGQVTLVNLWATWCAPCLRELPELLELEADLADRGFSLIAAR